MWWSERLTPELRPLSVLIDSAGEIVWAERAAMSADHYRGSALDNFAAARVIERGYVHWLVREGNVLVRLRPSMTSDAARDRVYSWLDRSMRQRYLIAVHAGGKWDYASATSGPTAQQRLEEAFGEHGSGTIRRLAHPITPSSFPAGRKGLIDFWRHHSRNFNVETALPVLRGMLDGQFVLFHARRPGDYRIAEFGDALPHVSRAWLAANVGRPLVSQPDAAHAMDCLRTYCQVQRCHEPLEEDIDALIKWPGRDRMRRRYSRTVLPWHSKDGEWVLSATRQDPSIDLRD